MSAPSATAAGEPCPACAAPMAADQRYCLTCGEVRPGASRPLPAALRAAVPAGGPGPAAPATRSQPPGLTAGLAGLACLLLALGVGVLIGRGGKQATPPAAITVSGAAPGASSPDAPAAAPASFASDWPADREGWTIALQSLPKNTADPAAVAAAKIQASAKGAPAVGALDSDAYPSLTAGSYVVYSGVFSTRDIAGGALKPLRATFADARIVEVSQTVAAAASPTTTSPSKGSGTSTTSRKPSAGTDTRRAFDESRKQPKTLGTGGKPPPKDNKPAAGGGGFQDIG